MMINGQGDVFLGNRQDTPGTSWQMPQGGIDEGETPESAMARELFEETGVQKVVFLAQSNHWYTYDLPAELQAKLWGGIYRGQRQKWFLVYFPGKDSDIILDQGEREFSGWRWAPLKDVPLLIVPFKRKVYDAIVQEFAPKIRAFIKEKGA